MLAVTMLGRAGSETEHPPPKSVTPAKSVTWLDHQTLRVELPAKLPAGLYAITVANPNGQSGQRATYLRLGRSLFLPVAGK